MTEITYEKIAQNRTLPDEATFCEWIRLYCNEQISASAYGSEEEHAFQSLLGAVLDTGSDLEDDETRLDLLKSDLWAEVTEESTSEVSRNIHFQMYEIIAYYQTKTQEALLLSGADMGLIMQALHVWIEQSLQEDGHKPYYLTDLAKRFERFFSVKNDYLITKRIP